MNSFLKAEKLHLLKIACVLALFAVLTNCGGTPNMNAESETAKPPFAELPITEKALVGKWIIVNKLDAKEVERQTKVKGAFSFGGTLTFKEDKTYTLEFQVFANEGTNTATTSGTYKYENDVLSLTDQKNKTQKSSLKIENDLVRVDSLEQGTDPGFVIYLKRGK